MRFGSSMPRRRKGVNIGGDRLRRRPAGGLLGEPALEPFEPGAVAQPEVLVADALAAGQQGVGELLGRQMDVAGDVLEPFGRVARGRLQPQHLDLALGLVGREHPRQVAAAALDQLRASAIASSSASLVPEPIEKCAE